MTTYETRNNLKLDLGITDTARDTLLDACLAAASRSVEAYTGRSVEGFQLAAAVSAYTYDPQRRVVCGADGEKLLIDEYGTATGLAVQRGTAGSTSWTAITTYEALPDNALARGVPVSSLYLATPYGPWALSSLTRIRVTAKWGWPAVPSQVVDATRRLAARLFKRKDSPDGLSGGDWGVTRVGRVDPDVAELLSPFCLDGVG